MTAKACGSHNILKVNELQSDISPLTLDKDFNSTLEDTSLSVFKPNIVEEIMYGKNS